MILQSLVELYETLAEKGDIIRPGWGLSKISFALYLNDAGNIIECVSLKENTKKTIIPVHDKRTSGVFPYFLCDNSAYILGIDATDNSNCTKCFEASRGLHEKILSDVDVPAAKAILAFYKTWQPENAASCEALQDSYQEILRGANLTFRYDGSFAHNDPKITDAWQKYHMSNENKEQGVCLVTGKTAPIARLHPVIKGVRESHQSGASLVSFNEESSCSYNFEQGMNAQTSEYAAFAYGAALNYLIADREHTSYIGDTLVLCWAKKAETEYQDAFCACLYGDDIKYSEGDLRDMMKSISTGEHVCYDEKLLDPDMEFYILGIAANSARLAVKFFLRNSFGKIIKNINEHYNRLEIVKPSYEKNKYTVSETLEETVNKKSKDKKIAAQLTAEYLRAVLNNTNYPTSLINCIELRIRAEHEINDKKAATIKAYYLKNKNKDVPEEVLTVSLNKESTNTAYVLGRLFYVFERMQKETAPEIKSTITDRYFNSAVSMPAKVFPTLINLSFKHLKKIEKQEIRSYYEKQIGEIMSLLGDEFPKTLNLCQQGCFQLGYYHQKQERYKKQNEEENTNE